MTYQPFLIANYSTGIDRKLQPWLTADDSWEELLDGYVYRGITNKRDGYQGFATGKNSTICESRMVRRISAEATGQVNNGGVLANITLSNNPVRRGTCTITDGVESHTDNGTGSFTTAAAGSINYTTGVISGFQFNAASAAAVTVTYDYHQGFPVLGVMNFWDSNNNRKLVVADTSFVNAYNNTTDVLDDITPTGVTYTGVYNATTANFWSWVNYADKEDDPRLLFVNNSNKIQQYDGTTVSNYIAGVETDEITAEFIAAGVGVGPYNHTTANNLLVAANQNTSPAYDGFTITDAGSGYVIVDNGDGTLGGTSGSSGSGTVNYETGVINFTFDAGGGTGNITITYKYYSTEIDTCLHIFEFKDRLICLRTTEGGTVKPRRIRISGFGQNADIFTQDAPGAGVIDLPDNSWITGATFNRDDLLIFTERSTWVLKYTGSDTVPFTPERIDESRGCDAPFSPITYLNRSMAASTRGLIVSDGYKIERMDDKIPYFTLNNIYNREFFKCFSGFIDEDRDIYLIYPDDNDSSNNKMLVINMEEDNFAVYRIPLTCMGNYYVAISDIRWLDLTAANGFPNWDVLAAKYGSWSAFPVTQYAPIAIGGGPNGQIWSLNTTETEDNPLNIRAVQDLGGNPRTLRITTDLHNYKTNDVIYFSGLGGSTELNGFQGFIERVDNYTFDLQDAPSITAYTSGGIASKSVEFDASTKQFNPFAEQAQKVRTGWIYFYLEVNESQIINNQQEEIPSQLNVQVFTNNVFGPTTPNIAYKIGMEPPDNRPQLRAWYKMWVNQVGDFLQFRITNNQALTKVKVHAMMPGFQPQGPIR